MDSFSILVSNFCTPFYKKTKTLWDSIFHHQFCSFINFKRQFLWSNGSQYTNSNTVTFKPEQSLIGEVRKKQHEIEIYHCSWTIHPCSYLSISADWFGRAVSDDGWGSRAVTLHTVWQAKLAVSFLFHLSPRATARQGTDAGQTHREYISTAALSLAFSSAG